MTPGKARISRRGQDSLLLEQRGRDERAFLQWGETWAEALCKLVVDVSKGMADG